MSNIRELPCPKNLYSVSCSFYLHYARECRYESHDYGFRNWTFRVGSGVLRIRTAHSINVVGALVIGTTDSASRGSGVGIT
jgi:hypothetical protein